MKNIREDKGYTYGIGSMLAEIYQNGYFAIMTQVGKDFVEQTIEEIKKEIELLRTELVGEEELTMVRNYIMGQSLKAADGPFAMMDLFIQVETANLDYSFYNDAIHVLKTISAEEIRSIAQQYLVWDEMLVITAGQQLN
jgi:predicted Zn-dependent peptidase